MSRRMLYGAAALAAGLGFCTHAGATTITTTSLSTWDSSAYTISGSQDELNFGTIHVGTTYDTSTGIMLYAMAHPSVGFDFSGPDNGGYNLTGVTYGCCTGLAGASDGVGYLKVATPSNGENALFLSIGSTGSTPLTLLLSDGESFSGLSSGNFGFALSHSISWLQLSTTSGSQPVIDDFYYGSSSVPQDAPTAEVATFFLFGGGLLILFGARRKLRSLVT